MFHQSCGPSFGLLYLDARRRCLTARPPLDVVPGNILLLPPSFPSMNIGLLALRLRLRLPSTESKCLIGGLALLQQCSQFDIVGLE